MKKILLLSVMIMVLLNSLAAAADAASDKIGFIDSVRILASHPRYEESQRYLDDFTEQKVNEARAAAEREPNEERRLQIIDEARFDSEMESVRVMNPITIDINRVIEVVAQSRGVTVVVERGLVYFGGIDLTEDVVRGMSALR